MDALVCTASDGVRCAARVAGRTGEPLIFVHGVGSTAEIWEPQLTSLSQHLRCAAVELRGNGVAPVPVNLSSITRTGFARDALAVADAFGAQRFHLVGCGLGGIVGLELWRLAPGRIASFCLLDSFAAYPDGEAVAAGIIDDVLTAPSLVTYSEGWANLLLPPRAPAYRRTASVRQMAQKDRRAFTRFTLATWTCDYRPLLASIAVPTLLLWGEHDRIVPRVLCEELAANIRGAHLVTVPDAGHHCHADAPAFVDAALEAFIGAVPNLGT
ncbi:alpha/beta hydrolase [bacterium]|nr:MAG: alpha/beta hydrolase [bacterium]